MDTYDLIDVRLPVVIGEKAFEVRRLRLCDVLRILARFDDELRAFVAQKQPNALELFHSLKLEDTADLLAFTLDPYDPEHVRKHMDLSLAVQLTTIAGQINDVPRIWNALKIGGPEPEPKKIAELLTPASVQPVPPMVRVIDQLAARYGIDPLGILKWPFEAFLTLVDAFAADRIEKERQALLLNGLDPDLLDDSAIQPGPIADLNKLVN